MSYANLTQEQQILKYIDEYGSITPLEAMRDLGIMRLSARIHDLKKSGYNFSKTMDRSVNRFGIKTCFARYSLVLE